MESDREDKRCCGVRKQIDGKERIEKIAVFLDIRD
jgi:hypothetical protein